MERAAESCTIAVTTLSPWCGSPGSSRAATEVDSTLLFAPVHHSEARVISVLPKCAIVALID